MAFRSHVEKTNNTKILQVVLVHFSYFPERPVEVLLMSVGAGKDGGPRGHYLTTLHSGYCCMCSACVSLYSQSEGCFQ